MRWWLAAVAVGLAACGPLPATPWTWSLPTGTPAPAVPTDNPLTVEKVELGRHLFFDKRLSKSWVQFVRHRHSFELVAVAFRKACFHGCIPANSSRRS